MSHLLVSVFAGQVPAELVRVPDDRPAVLVTWEVLPAEDGPTVRFDVAGTTHTATPSRPDALGAMLHVLAHALLGPDVMPSAMPDTAAGGA